MREFDRRFWGAVLLSAIAGCGESRPPTPSDAGRAPDASKDAGDTTADTDLEASTSDAAATPTPDAAVPSEPAPRPGAAPDGSEAAPVAGSFALSEGTQQALEKRAEDEAITRADFDARYAAEFATLDFDPATAERLDLIQASALALDEAHLRQLHQDAVVVDSGRLFPSFAYGYQSLYALDLPVFVSVDAVVDTLHAHYDTALAHLERTKLEGALAQLLDSMRDALAARTDDAGSAAHRDVDLYLTVAESLLHERPRTPLFASNQETVQQCLQHAGSARGLQSVRLFGEDRTVDFSQFEPRGHYMGGLEGYFRAMMWLGRIDFRLIESVDGAQVFQRRQLEAAWLARELMERATGHYDRLQRTIAAFVGEPDYMTPEDVDALREALAVDTLTDLRELDDATLIRALHEGDFGLQRIASHLLLGSAEPGQTTPLNRSFALLGQRYVVDSEVFSNLVWDRVQVQDAPWRMMPDPLDVAFAALGNDQAAALLGEELDEYQYHGALHATRRLVDAHEDGYWAENLYTRWLGALRGLSPARWSDALPNALRTEAWGRRLLQTQLASWSQLRHSTLLYAKQSYTGVAVCEFPDAYVDPYPEVFQALIEMFDEIHELVSVDDGLGGTQGPQHVLARLRDIAQAELDGVPLSAADLGFINDMIHVGGGCAITFEGWLATDLGATEDFDPTIADVHTQPTDRAGNFVGHVLHVAAGYPRLMVTTIDTPQGVRAFAGVVFGYHELQTDSFDRLDDERWSRMLASDPSRPVPGWTLDGDSPRLDATVEDLRFCRP